MSVVDDNGTEDVLSWVLMKAGANMAILLTVKLAHDIAPVSTTPVHVRVVHDRVPVSISLVHVRVVHDRVPVSTSLVHFREPSTTRFVSRVVEVVPTRKICQPYTETVPAAC